MILLFFGKLSQFKLPPPIQLQLVASSFVQPQPLSHHSNIVDLPSNSQHADTSPCLSSNPVLSIEKQDLSNHESPSKPTHVTKPQPTTQIIIRPKTGNLKPKLFPDFKSFISTKHPLRMLSSVYHKQEPSCFTQAVSIFEWWDAMGCEFDALMANGTWSLCPRPLHKPVVRNKWVYKIKRKKDGNI